MASPSVEARRVNITKYLDEQAANVAAASIAPGAASGVGGEVLAVPPTAFNNINVTTVAAFTKAKEKAAAVGPAENVGKQLSRRDADVSGHASASSPEATQVEKTVISTATKKPVLKDLMSVPTVPSLAIQQRIQPLKMSTTAYYGHHTSSVPEVDEGDVDDDDDDGEDDGDGGDTDSGEGLLYRDNVDLDTIEFYLPTAFTSRRHLEPVIAPPRNQETWRVVPKDRMKTVSVALILCLNVGVDPPDVDKPQSCARIECWIDPFGTDPYGMEEGVYRPIDRIGNELEKQYKRWQQRARYKQCLDPTTDDVKKLVVTLRKNAKDERVLFHYNGHGVPKPTQNGEIWVFNKQYTQYIPLSIYDLASWVGVPAVYVFDCHNAGVISEAFLTFVNSCDAAEQQQQQQAASVDGNNNATDAVSNAQFGGGLRTSPQTPTRAAAAAAAVEPGAGYNNDMLGVQGAGVTPGSDGGEAAGFQHSGSPPLGEGAPKPATWRELREVTVFLCACSRGQELPMNAELPADVFTACLTTPIKMALQFFWLHNRDRHKNVTLEMLDRIPGQMQDRRTMLGELNWIFTAITDTIAWNILPRELFQKLFRQDLLLASLLRNFLLAQRIMQRYGCFPVAHPRLPNSTVEHSMWDAWDLVLDDCFFQFSSVIDMSPTTAIVLNAEQPQQMAAATSAGASNPPPAAAAPSIALKPFQNSSFFSDQLTSFQVWLTCGNAQRRPPEQLPVILQVLLSHSHRLRALDLLGRFCDLGPWAVNQALSVGIFPYILKLMQATARELRPYLVFIWAKIMAVDATVQPDMTRDNAHRFFMLALGDQTMPMTHRTMAAFCLAQLLNGNDTIKAQALKDNVIATCLENLSTEVAPSFRQWLALALGHLWHDYAEARWQGTRDSAHEELWLLLQDSDAEVRASCIYALRTFLAANQVRLMRNSRRAPSSAGSVDTLGGSGNITDDHADSIDSTISMKLLTNVLIDGSVLVRKELIISLHWFVLLYEKELLGVAMQLAEEERFRENLQMRAAEQQQIYPNATVIKDVVTVSRHKASAPSTSAAHLIYPPDYSVALPTPASSNNSTLHKFSAGSRGNLTQLDTNFSTERAGGSPKQSVVVAQPDAGATTGFASFLPFLRSSQSHQRQQQQQQTPSFFNRAKSPLPSSSTGNMPPPAGRRSAVPPPPPPPPPMPSSGGMPRVSSSSQLLALQQQQQQQSAMLTSPSSSTTSLTKSTANAINLTLRKVLAQQQHSSAPGNLITYPPYSSMLTYGNIYQNVWRTLLYFAYDAYPELATMAADIANYIQCQVAPLSPAATPTTMMMSSGEQRSTLRAAANAPPASLAALFGGGAGSEESLTDYDANRRFPNRRQNEHRAGGDRNDALQQKSFARGGLNRSISLQQPSHSSHAQEAVARFGGGGGAGAAVAEDAEYADEASTTPIASNQTPLRAQNVQNKTRNAENFDAEQQQQQQQLPAPHSARYQRSRKLFDPGPTTDAGLVHSSDEGESNSNRLSRFLTSPVVPPTPTIAAAPRRLDAHLDSAFADWCATYYANPLTGVEAQDDPLSTEYVRKKLRTQRNREIRATFRHTQQQHTGPIRYQNQMFVQKNQPQAFQGGSSVPVVTLFEDYRPYLLVADADCVSVWNWQDGLLANSFLNGHMRGHRIRDLKLINNHDAPLLAVASDDGTVRVWRHYDDSFAPYMLPSYSSSIHSNSTFVDKQQPTSASAEDLTKEHATTTSSSHFGLLRRMASSASTSSAAVTSPGGVSSKNQSRFQHNFTNSSPLAPVVDYRNTLPTSTAAAAAQAMPIVNKYAEESNSSDDVNYYYWGSTTRPAHLVTAWNALPEIAFPPPSAAITSTGGAVNPSTVNAGSIAAGQLSSLKYSGAGIVTAFEQKPRLLILSGDVRFIRIWDLKQERKVHDIPTDLSGNSSAACVSALASDPNRAAMFVAGFGDGGVALYDRRCAPQHAQVQRYSGHQSWILSACIPTTFDDQRIYTASTNGEVRVWEMRMAECVHKIPVLPNTSAMHRHPNAGILACGSSPPAAQQRENSAVALYSTMGEQTSVLRFYDGFGGQRIGPVSCLSFHPYRHLLAIGTGDHMVSIVSAEKDRKPLYSPSE